MFVERQADDPRDVQAEELEDAEANELQSLQDVGEAMTSRLNAIKQQQRQLRLDNTAVRAKIYSTSRDVIELSDAMHRLDSDAAALSNAGLLKGTSSGAVTVEPLLPSNHSQAPTVEPPVPGTHSQFTTFACLADVITISCPTDRTIFITSADYAEFPGCPGCCGTPHPTYHCTVPVQDARPSDWLAMKLRCDNQNTCQFQVLGSLIDECQAGYVSDYLQVYYDCLPYDETTAVGFTATASGGFTYYSEGGLILFDDVLSNTGGHYNPTTSTFLCPWDGVYVISVNVQGYEGDGMIIDIMQNSIELVDMYVAAASNVHSRASTTIVISAARGDAIWVRAGMSNYIYHGNGYTLFSGHLLQRYYQH